jgi:hypothetical protein
LMADFDHPLNQVGPLPASDVRPSSVGAAETQLNEPLGPVMPSETAAPALNPAPELLIETPIVEVRRVSFPPVQVGDSWFTPMAEPSGDLNPDGSVALTHEFSPVSAEFDFRRKGLEASPSFSIDPEALRVDADVRIDYESPPDVKLPLDEPTAKSKPRIEDEESDPVDYREPWRSKQTQHLDQSTGRTYWELSRRELGPSPLRAGRGRFRRWIDRCRQCGGVLALRRCARCGAEYCPCGERLEDGKCPSETCPYSESASSEESCE